MHLISVSALLWVQLFAASEGSTSTLSFEDAWRLATKNHPAIAAAQAQLEVEYARVDRAFAGYLPGITAHFSYDPQTANFAPLPSYRRGLEQRSPQGLTTLSNSVGQDVQTYCIPQTDSNGQPVLGVCQPVLKRQRAADFQMENYWTVSAGIVWTAFDWGETLYAHRAAKASAGAQRLSEKAVEMDVKLEVTLSYFAVVAGEASIHVAAQAVDAQTRHLEQVRALFARGLKNASDIAIAEADLSDAQLMFEQSRHALDGARANLKAILGITDDEVYQLTTPMAPSETIEAMGVMDERVLRHPQIQALALRVDSLEHQAQSARGRYFPRLVLNFGQTAQGPGLNSLIPNLQGGIALVYPNSSWVGMNPFAVTADVDEASANARLLEAQSRELIYKLRQQARQAHSRATAALSILHSAVLRRDATHERHQWVQKQYDKGASSLIELSEAELAHIGAQMIEIRARFAVIEAVAMLDHIRGQEN